MTDERRIKSRRRLGDFVTAIFDDDAALCLGVDISEDAIYVRSTTAVDDALANHEGPIVLQFELGNGERSWACGRTRRTGQGSEGDGTTIAFTYIPQHTRDTIRAYVNAA